MGPEIVEQFRRECKAGEDYLEWLEPLTRLWQTAARLSR
jgi:hypothetical protein